MNLKVKVSWLNLFGLLGLVYSYNAKYNNLKYDIFVHHNKKNTLLFPIVHFVSLILNTHIIISDSPLE